ncbi:Membrane-bound lytic murein transglycosylase A homolog (Murein hydrolase A) [Durusdinium trenchii]|uniref:peptidoglycan lytic exotransglycosylase n=1 Tax=Durusdinium trenchii TaxID=1381693 RepID=A0ABP0LKW7_9DINO
MDPVLLILAGVTAFILFRLISVMGTRTGHEQRQEFEPAPQKSARDSQAEAEFADDADDMAAPKPVSTNARVLRDADPSFDEAAFLDGARGAYEMIVEGFASGDLRSLRAFLSDSIYDAFKSAVVARDDAGHEVELKFVGIDHAAIVDSEVDGQTMSATAEFTSNQVRVTRDREGEVVDGDPNRIDLDATPVIAPTFRQTVIFFLAGAVAVILTAIFVFGGFFPVFEEQAYDDSAFEAPRLALRPVQFADLDGWRADDLKPAFDAFLQSCEAIDGMERHAQANPQENLGAPFSGISLGGVAADWQSVCETGRRLAASLQLGDGDRSAVLRQFFEVEFAPMQVLNRRDPLPDGPAAGASSRLDDTGVFTGYFEPAYRAARNPTPLYTVPVYARPDDLVEVDLGAFRDELAGERIAGRIKGARLVPYPDHHEINNGALDGLAETIAWLAPNDLFFLQIQGSGQLIFDDGSRQRVGYAGQNGQPYTAIGRVMVRDGVMALSDVSMQSIRQWLDTASVDDARRMREENESYVFFRPLDGVSAGDGPLGAQGVSLTQERSLAVDRRFHALGAPVWVDIDPVPGNGPDRIRRLMIAQDTGGAIRGPVRGDVFWGSGAQAEAVAGKMNASGRMYVLLPRNLAAQISVLTPQ